MEFLLLSSTVVKGKMTNCRCSGKLCIDIVLFHKSFNAQKHDKYSQQKNLYSSTTAYNQEYDSYNQYIKHVLFRFKSTVSHEKTKKKLSLIWSLIISIYQNLDICQHFNMQPV